MKPAIKKEELGPDNEWGTTELTNKYKSETPGQTPKNEGYSDTYSTADVKKAILKQFPGAKIKIEMHSGRPIFDITHDSIPRTPHGDRAFQMSDQDKYQGGKKIGKEWNCSFFKRSSESNSHIDGDGNSPEAAMLDLKNKLDIVESTNDTIRNIVKQNANLYRDNELAKQSREDDMHQRMLDMADLRKLLTNPPEEYAKRQYGSVEAYKKMIQNKIDKMNKKEGIEEAIKYPTDERQASITQNKVAKAAIEDLQKSGYTIDTVKWAVDYGIKNPSFKLLTKDNETLEVKLNFIQSAPQVYQVVVTTEDGFGEKYVIANRLHPKDVATALLHFLKSFPSISNKKNESLEEAKKDKVDDNNGYGYDTYTAQKWCKSGKYTMQPMSFKSKGPKRWVLVPKDKNESLEDSCWDGYTAIGTKEKDGKTVPNCVPESLDLARQVKMAGLITGERNKALLESFVVAHPITDRHLEFTAIRAEFNKFKKLHEANIGMDELSDLSDKVRHIIQTDDSELGDEIIQTHGLKLNDIIRDRFNKMQGPKKSSDWNRIAKDIADSIISDYQP